MGVRRHVERHLAGGLHGVGVEQGAVPVGELGELVHLLDRPDDVVGGHDRDEARVRAQRGGEGRRRDDAVLADRQVRDLHAETLEVLGRLDDGGMLERGHDEVVAGALALEHAAQGQVVGLGAAGR